MFELSRLFGGFFASPAIMESSPHWKFIEVFSYLQYTFLGVALNELEGLELKCDKGTTCIPNGETTINANDYDLYTIG
jgi:ATP-binding cassette subfamily G (WHITE) protein 2